MNELPSVYIKSCICVCVQMRWAFWVKNLQFLLCTFTMTIISFVGFQTWTAWVLITANHKVLQHLLDGFRPDKKTWHWQNQIKCSKVCCSHCKQKSVSKEPSEGNYNNINNNNNNIMMYLLCCSILWCYFESFNAYVYILLMYIFCTLQICHTQLEGGVHRRLTKTNTFKE